MVLFCASVIELSLFFHSGNHHRFLSEHYINHAYILFYFFILQSLPCISKLVHPSVCPTFLLFLCLLLLLPRFSQDPRMTSYFLYYNSNNLTYNVFNFLIPLFSLLIINYWKLQFLLKFLLC